MNQFNKLVKKLFAICLIAGLIVGIFRYTIHTQQTTKSNDSQKSAERAPASIQPQDDINIIKSIEIPLRTEISQDVYKNNIRDKKFYSQILDQLYENAAVDAGTDHESVSFALSQNIILFDHILGFEHPYRLSFLSATEKMLQEKEKLASELNLKKLTTNEFKTRFHSTMDKYQAECAHFLNDQDFVKLFLITKNDKFSSHIGL